MNLLNAAAPMSVAMMAPVRGPEIRKGVPMPGARSGPTRGAAGTGAEATYRWAEMEVGDSFIALAEHDAGMLRSAAWKKGCSMGRDYSVRALPDGTIGVWRTK